MRLLLLAFLLLVQQPSKPPDAPGKAKQSENSSPEAVQVAAPSQGVGSASEERPTHHSEKADQYDPRKDCLYRWYMRATIVGVLGGFVGIALLIWQSILLRNSVDAAHKSADALIDSEAAFLTVEGQEFALITDAARTFVKYPVCNVGRTVALVFGGEDFLQIGDDPENPPTPSLYEEKRERPTDFYLPAGKPSPCTTFLSETGQPIYDSTKKEPFKASRMTAIDQENINNRSKTLWSYGFIRYRDTFKRAFELRFCHRYEPTLMPNPGFIVAGPPEFNRLTRYKENKN
jgi:hypothetical protein